MNGKKILFMILTVVMAFTLTCSYANAQETVTIPKDEYERLKQYETMDSIRQFIEEYYIDEPDTDLMMEYGIQGMLAALNDPYTFYYNAEDWATMIEDDEGVYAGIGVQLLGDYEKDTVTITRVFKDTPAEAAGIRKGDQIVKTEDLDVTAQTMQAAVAIMRGTVGEIVNVQVLRDGETLSFDIPRAQIIVNRIESAMLDKEIAYLAIYEFAGASDADFIKAYQALKAQGAKALILDLRDNPGGWVSSCVDTADLFLDGDMIYYAEDRYGNRETVYADAGAETIPLVVLVNGNSASSSEILAGALQDAGRATIVGEKSFGKGIIQSVIELGEEYGGFQMTVAEYYLSSGKAVHKVGITPDIECAIPEDLQDAYFAFGDLNDPQLKAAWDAAVLLSENAQAAPLSAGK